MLFYCFNTGQEWQQQFKRIHSSQLDYPIKACISNQESPSPLPFWRKHFRNIFAAPRKKYKIINKAVKKLRHHSSRRFVWGIQFGAIKSQHFQPFSAYYSLYFHIESINCTIGQKVPEKTPKTTEKLPKIVKCGKLKLRQKYDSESLIRFPQFSRIWKAWNRLEHAFFFGRTIHLLLFHILRNTICIEN